MKFNSNNGITIIALVITIIVILIISAILINISFNNGIIEKAHEGANKYSEKETEEKELLGNLDDYISQYCGKKEEKCEVLYHADKLSFNGENYVNTGIRLFNSENINKDFEISFEVTGCYNGGRYMGIVDPTDTEKYNGIELYSTEGRFAMNAKMNSEGYWYTFAKENLSESNPFRVRIRRIGDVILLTINDDKEKMISDFTNTKKIFDSPLSFGAGLDENENPIYLSRVEFRNVNVKYINISNYQETKTADSYKLDGIIKFDGTNYIDTGINLFSNENKGKDFEISFDTLIYSKANDQVLVECKDRTKNNLKGFNIRFVDDRYEIYCNDNTNCKETYNKLTENIKVKRKYGVVRIIRNNEEEKNIARIDPIDSTLVIGASLDSNGTASSFYKGVIANIEVKLTEKENITSYNLEEEVNFDGTNYLDTGVQLFSDENKNKDFDISFDVVKIDKYTNKATLMSAMDELSKPWPGVVYRLNTDQNKFEIRGGYNGNTSWFIPYGEQNVKITRRNKIISYSINGSEAAQVDDFSNVRSYDYPVTFGAGLDELTIPRRFFKGTLSNLKVELKQ